MSDPNVPLGPNCAQKRIDDEILKLGKRSIQLEVERNVHAAISRLPDSVMSEIFTILASTCALDSWYKINLVCQHWRDVALGTVALWTTPPTHHHDLTMLMLERSKMADLSVGLTWKTSLDTSTTLFREIGRIHSLSIEERIPLFDQAMLAVKDCARLRLKKVNIEFSYDMVPLDLPLLNLDVLLIPSLTHFCLDIEDILHCPRISLRRLLSILQAMQNLEYLKLKADIISQDASQAQVGFHDVHLPLLHALEISLHSSMESSWPSEQHTISFLSHLRLPRLDGLVVHVFQNSPHFMRTVWSTIGRGDFKTSQKLLFNQYYRCKLEPLQQISKSRLWNVGMDVGLLGYDANGPNPLAPDVMETLDDATLLSRILELEIEDMDESNTDFVRLFGRLRNVESIRVNWEWMPRLINALAIVSNGSPQMFPKLLRIVVTPYNGSGYYIESRNFEGWYDSLMARHQAGAPIRELSLTFLSGVQVKKCVLRSFLNVGVEVVKIEELWGTKSNRTEEIR